MPPISGLVPAADVGCVAGPISAAGALPLDRDADMDSEHAGHQCRRKIDGELEHGRGSRLPGLNANFLEPDAQMGGGDRLSWSAAGEQPGGGFSCSDHRVALPVGNDLADQDAQGFGQENGFRAEAQQNLFSLDVDIVESQAADG